MLYSKSVSSPNFVRHPIIIFDKKKYVSIDNKVTMRRIVGLIYDINYSVPIIEDMTGKEVIIWARPFVRLT